MSLENKRTAEVWGKRSKEKLEKIFLQTAISN